MRRFYIYLILFINIYSSTLLTITKKIFTGSVVLLELGRDKIYLSQPEIQHRDQSSKVRTHPDAAW